MIMIINVYDVYDLYDLYDLYDDKCHLCNSSQKDLPASCMWCIVLGNSFLGRRFSEGVIIIINMMKRTPKHNSPKHNFSSWGALGMRYCMLRIQAWPDECNYSIKQAASKTPAKRTRIEPEDVKLQKSMREWLFFIHPFDPFPP